MTPDIDSMLLDRWGEENTSIFAPQSMQEIRDRLQRIRKSPCRCSDSPHLNALHGLADEDVPALLDIIERLTSRSRSRGE